MNTKSTKGTAKKSDGRGTTSDSAKQQQKEASSAKKRGLGETRSANSGGPRSPKQENL